MSVGAELTAAREQLGLSREDVSQRTKISTERLQAIELEDLPNLPPLVYLKGFVREYAAAVKLDPDEITNRYLLGLDEPAGLISREPDSLTADEPASPDVSVKADAGDEDRVGAGKATLLSSTASALFESEDDIVAEPPESPRPVLARSTAPAPAVRSNHPLLVTEADLGPPPRDADGPAPDVAWTSLGSRRSFHRSRRSFRGSRVVLGVAAAVLAGILISAYGGRFAFLSPRPANDVPEARSNARPPVRPDAAPASRVSAGATVESPARANDDRSNEPPPVARPPEPRAATPPPLPPVATPKVAAPKVPAPNVAAPNVAAPKVAAPNVAGPNVAPPVPPRPAVPPAATVAPTAVPVPDARAASPSALTGNWSLTTRIEATDVAAFENMNLGFRLLLQQDGERVTGRGLKWMENGKLIPVRSRTPIVVEGIRSGNRIELRFTEHGTARTSTGTFVMDVGDDGTLRGQFASTSANSSGSTIARRVVAGDK